MVSRKETPDVLGELLGSAATVPRPVPEAEPHLATRGEGAAALVVDPEPEPEEEPKPQPAVAPAAKPMPAPKRKTSTRPAGRQRQPKKVHWDYVEVVFCDHGGFRPRYINGQEVRNWKRTPPIHDYLNHLGEQGWELAGVGGRHKGQMPAYLKRLKL